MEMLFSEERRIRNSQGTTVSTIAAKTDKILACGHWTLIPEDVYMTSSALPLALVKSRFPSASGAQHQRAVRTFQSITPGSFL